MNLLDAVGQPELPEKRRLGAKSGSPLVFLLPGGKALTAGRGWRGGTGGPNGALVKQVCAAFLSQEFTQLGNESGLQASQAMSTSTFFLPIGRAPSQPVPPPANSAGHPVQPLSRPDGNFMISS